MPRILMIKAHPDPSSFGHALAAAYVEGARAAGAEVEELELARLTFDPVLRAGFRGSQPLEPDLQSAQEAMIRADLLSFQFPVWWGNLPALLKGFIDRTMLPGWAFRHVEGKSLPEGLLKGRGARIISTMDSPWWWYWLKHGRAAHRALTHATLHYVGIDRVKETTVYELRKLDTQAREQWLAKAKNAGQSDALRASRMLTSSMSVAPTAVGR